MSIAQRSVSGPYSSLIGDPNFALLLSTIAAMFLLFRQKKPTLSEMSRLVEQALMSAGVIILITAAGGAFGGDVEERLQVENVSDAVRHRHRRDCRSRTHLPLMIEGYSVARPTGTWF
ncbi:MAG: hypothetical protein R3C01_00665 [Planctomycetaceae bacterium]